MRCVALPVAIIDEAKEIFEANGLADAFVRLRRSTARHARVGDGGMRALAGACELGALPYLERFLVACNPCASPALVTRAILKVRKPRPRKVVAHYQWPADARHDQRAKDEQVEDEEARFVEGGGNDLDRATRLPAVVPS